MVNGKHIHKNLTNKRLYKAPDPSSLLKIYAERLWTNVIFSTNNPELPENKAKLENISKIISTILTLSKFSLLNEKQEKHLIDELQAINENPTTEKIKEKLLPIFNEFKNKHLKTSIVLQLIELESQHCSPKDEGAHELSHEEFQRLTKPILDYLQLDLKEMNVYRLQKKLEELFQNRLSTPLLRQALQELTAQLQKPD